MLLNNNNNLFAYLITKKDQGDDGTTGILNLQNYTYQKR